MNEYAALGERVRRLRLMNGMPQADLARALGLNGNAWVSKVENGRVGVEPESIQQLSSILGCTPEFLRRPLDEVLMTKPWLRAYADASARVVDGILAENLIVHEAAHMGRFRTVADTLPLFDGDSNDDDLIERFAGEVRAAAGIAEGDVVRNVIRAAERLGCVVLPLAHELGRHLGLSHRIDNRSYVRVSRPNVNAERIRMPGDRQRHTVAHELGHLGLHNSATPADDADAARRIEKEAHLFAAAFLAPAEPLLDDWSAKGGRVTLQILAELKATWGVSIKALVTRFRQLGIIDDDRARSLYKQISARGWNTAEPIDVPNERAVWLMKASTAALATDEAHAPKALAKFVGLDARHVEPWFDWEGPKETTGQVVEFRPRTTTSLRRIAPKGVTRLEL